jgi:hypothetical protein
MDVEIDLERLREDLVDEYGTAMFNGFPPALLDLSDVESASPEELIAFALKSRVDLGKYVV